MTCCDLVQVRNDRKASRRFQVAQAGGVMELLSQGMASWCRIMSSPNTLAVTRCWMMLLDTAKCWPATSQHFWAHIMSSLWWQSVGCHFQPGGWVMKGHFHQTDRKAVVGWDIWRWSSSTLAQARSARVSCPGPHTNVFWKSSRIETPQILWATYATPTIKPQCGSPRILPPLPENWEYSQP